LYTMWLKNERETNDNVKCTKNNRGQTVVCIWLCVEEGPGVA